jgi:hypothetical protein
MLQKDATRMSELRYKTVKTFTPDMAGQRVGWASVVETDREDGSKTYRVDGAYGTVGEEGATIRRLENTEGEIFYGSTDKYAEGISRACAWSFFVARGQDGWDLRGLRHQPNIRITGYDQFERGPHGGAEELFAGLYRHDIVHLEDERVQWGEGDDEILACIKARLEEHSASNIYSAMYLAINGVAGRSVYLRKGYASLEQMGEYQLADASHVARTRHEADTIGAFETDLHSKIRAGEKLNEKINTQQLTKSDVIDYDADLEGLSASFDVMRKEATLPQPAIHRAYLPDFSAAQSAFKHGVLPVSNSVKANNKDLSAWLKTTSSWVVSLKSLQQAELTKAGREDTVE